MWLHISNLNNTTINATIKYNQIKEMNKNKYKIHNLCIENLESPIDLFQFNNNDIASVLQTIDLINYFKYNYYRKENNMIELYRVETNRIIETSVEYGREIEKITYNENTILYKNPTQKLLPIAIIRLIDFH